MIDLKTAGRDTARRRSFVVFISVFVGSFRTTKCEARFHCIFLSAIVVWLTNDRFFSRLTFGNAVSFVHSLQCGASCGHQVYLCFTVFTGLPKMMDDEDWSAPMKKGCGCGLGGEVGTTSTVCSIQWFRFIISFEYALVLLNYDSAEARAWFLRVEMNLQEFTCIQILNRIFLTDYLYFRFIIMWVQIPV